jgi:hypothetical protein
VFERVQMRKAINQEGAPVWGPKLKNFLSGGLKRRLTSLEVDYLLNAVGNPNQESFLRLQLQEGMGRGEDVEDVIEDVVNTAILHQIQLIVQRLRSKGKSVSMTALVRTLRPLSNCMLAEPSSCGAALCVGVSPLVSWFSEEPTMAWDSEEEAEQPRLGQPISSPDGGKQVDSDDAESSCGITGSPQSSLEDLLQDDQPEEVVRERRGGCSARLDAQCPPPRRVSFRDPVNAAAHE